MRTLSDPSHASRRWFVPNGNFANFSPPSPSATFTWALKARDDRPLAEGPPIRPVAPPIAVSYGVFVRLTPSPPAFWLRSASPPPSRGPPIAPAATTLSAGAKTTPTPGATAPAPTAQLPFPLSQCCGALGEGDTTAVSGSTGEWRTVEFTLDAAQRAESPVRRFLVSARRWADALRRRLQGLARGSGDGSSGLTPTGPSPCRSRQVRRLSGRAIAARRSQGSAAGPLATGASTPRVVPDQDGFSR